MQPQDERAEPLPYERERIPLRHSRGAKVSFGIGMIMVVCFFLLHCVTEAFLLGGMSGPPVAKTPPIILLYYVLPVIGMVISLLGAWIGFNDLRKPARNHEFSMTGMTINLVIFVGLIILLTLTIKMG